MKINNKQNLNEIKNKQNKMTIISLHISINQNKIKENSVKQY